MDINELSFQLISVAGMAKSYFQEAISLARKNEIDEANKKVAEGSKFLIEAHQIQTDMLTNFAKGEDILVSIILVHAQDHLTNAQMTRDTAKEFIALYSLLYQKEVI